MSENLTIVDNAAYAYAYAYAGKVIPMSRFRDLSSQARQKQTRYFPLENENFHKDGRTHRQLRYIV